MRILTRIITRFLFYVGICVVSCLSQGCQNYTWIQIPQAKPNNSFIINGINGQSACQSACINLATCYGVTWDGTNCYLNNASSSQLIYNAASQPSPTYFSLIRNYPSCAASGCFYTWNGQNHIHGFSGAENGKIDVNECIKSCQDDPSCNAVDFDYTINPPSCWIIRNSLGSGNADTVYHFNKDCTVTTPNTQTTLTGSGAPTIPVTTLPGQTIVPQTPVAGQNASTLTLSTSSSAISRLNQSSSTTAGSTSSKASASSVTATTLVAAASSTKSNQLSTTPNQSNNQTSRPTSVSENMPLVTSTTPQTGGSCGGATCNDLQVCGSDQKCTCDFNCDNTGSEPVTCGSDGNYYNNWCILREYSCETNTYITVVNKSICDQKQNNSTGTDGSCACLAIKPAYIVLIGVGGGCLLLVLTAIIILCQYPMNPSRSRDGGTPIYGTGNGDGGVCYTQEIVMEEGQMTVENNPYYNKSEISSPPDFTKEENIM